MNLTVGGRSDKDVSKISSENRFENGSVMAELQTKFRAVRKALPQQLNMLRGEDVIHPVSNKCLYKALDLGRRIIEEDDSLRKKTLGTLWIDCLYPTINRIRRHKFDEAMKASFALFTDAMVGFLKDIEALHPDLSSNILCFCGDLARYRALYSGPQDYYTKVAEQRYLSALEHHENDGSIYNRLGVLYQKDDLFKSLLCFSYALTEVQLFAGALTNIRNMDIEKLPKSEHQELLEITVLLAQNLIDSADSVEVNQQQWQQFLREGSLDALIKAVTAITHMSLYLSSKGTQESVRKCILVCHALWITLIEKLASSDDELRELEVKQRKSKNCRRRRCRKDSDSEDEASDEEDVNLGDREDVDFDKLRITLTDRLCVAGTSLSQWILKISKDIATHDVKLPIFTQEQLSSLVQGLTELVNPVIGQIREYIEDESLQDFVPIPLFVEISDWEKQFELLAYSVKECIDSGIVPISLGRYLEYNANRQTTNKLMENLAKVRLECEQLLEDEKAQFPVYVLPDLQVLQTKLHHIKRLLTLDNAPKIVIGQAILATLDKNKKGCPNIREAIRWIETILKSNQGVIKSMNEGSSLVDCAESLIPADENRNLSGLFATVIVSEMNSQTEAAKHEWISVETADSIIARWTKKSSKANGDKKDKCKKSLKGRRT